MRLTSRPLLGSTLAIFAVCTACRAGDAGLSEAPGTKPARPEPQDATPSIAWTNRDQLVHEVPRLVAQLGHANPVSACELSEDGALLATLAGEGPAVLWDVASGRELARFDLGDENAHSVIFARDGSGHIFVGGERSVVVWDEEGNELQRLELPLEETPRSPYSGPIAHLLLSPDGGELLASRNDRRVRTAAVVDGQLEPFTETSWTGVCGSDVGFDTGGRRLRLETIKTTEAWNGPGRLVLGDTSGAELWSLDVQQASDVESRFACDGTALFLRVQETVLCVDLEDLTERWRLTTQGNPDAQLDPAAPWQERWRFSGARLWTHVQGTRTRPNRFFVPNDMLFNERGELLVREEEQLVVLDARTGRPQRRIPFRQGGYLSWSANGEILLLITPPRRPDPWEFMLPTPSAAEPLPEPEGVAAFDAGTGELLQRYRGKTREGLTSVQISADDARIAVTMGTPRRATIFDPERPPQTDRKRDEIVVWDVANGSEALRIPQGMTADFVGRGDRLAVGKREPEGGGWSSFSAPAEVWDLATKERELLFESDEETLRAFVHAADPGLAAIYAEAKPGEGINRSVLASATGSLVRVAPDGLTALVGMSTREGQTWSFDLRTGQPLAMYRRQHPAKEFGWGQGVTLYDMDFAEDGTRVVAGGKGATGNWPTHARILRADSLEPVYDLPTRGGVERVAFAPDGTLVATASGGTIELWSATNGELFGTLEGHGNRLWDLTFSPDGRWLASASEDQTARVWDVASQRELLRLQHGGPAHGAAFTRDGSRLVSCSGDMTTRIWDTATGDELGRMLSFRDGSWAVVDALGRYDASNGGAVDGLHWVVGKRTIALEQLKARYFSPGLLTQLLGKSEEAPREVESFLARGIALPPEVEVLQSPTADDSTFRFIVTDAGGGIGAIAVFVNGKEVLADARPVRDPNLGRQEITLRLEEYPAYVPGIENDVEVVPFNAEHYLSSRGFTLFVQPKKKAEEGQIRLRAVVVGVSKYAGESLRLKYAAKDAKVFADTLESAGRAFFGASNVEVVRLLDEEATHTNVLAALDGLASARWFDVVVVYFAGHGKTWDGPLADDDGYFYLTQEARGFDLSDPGVRRATTVSSRDLWARLSTLPCRKQAVVLDTCYAGQLLSDFTLERSVPPSQRLALERLKDKTGTLLLASSAADAVSYESSPYGHGLLTYSLLLAMRQGTRPAVAEDGTLWALDLFQEAQRQVPLLAKGLRGSQEPQLAMPGAGVNFELGLLGPEERAAIELATPLPVITGASFELEDSPRDPANLTSLVRRRLREVHASEDTPSSLYVERTPSDAAYRVAGRYRQLGMTVEVRVFVHRGSREVARWTETGPERLLGELASRLAERARETVRDDSARRP